MTLLRACYLLAMLALAAATLTPAPYVEAQILGRAPPVADAHADFESDCEKCHKRGGKTDPNGGNRPNSKCLACHDDIAKRMNNNKGLHSSSPVSKASKSEEGCWSCHHDHLGRNFDMINSAKEGKGPAWRDVGGSQKNFNHNLTGYRLIGGHRGLECDKCHEPTKKRPKSQTRTFLGNRTECLACHENYHKFEQGDALNRCQKCHNFSSWTKFNLPLDFNHDNTSFPLRGAHKRMQCQQCHPKGKPFAPLAHGSCETCHTNDSIHGSTFASKNCVFCHYESTWKRRIKVSTKQHKARLSKKDYDPKGRHLTLGCETCHAGLKSSPKNGECTSCHNNVHGAEWVRKNKTCDKCHGEKVWEALAVTNKDHKTWSDWELTDRHLEVRCLKCHRATTGVPAEVPKQHDCAYCHTDIHKGSRGPECNKCHPTTSWNKEDIKFDHDTQTRFPLRGKHVNVTCEQCHPDPNTFKQRDHTCKACHGSPHMDKLPHECEQCHVEEEWREEKFDHNSMASFQLRGRHMQTPCFKCHMDMGFRGTPDSCRVCHWDYHDGEWGVSECKECHSAATWLFDRRRVIYENLHNFGDIVLAGAHEKVPCETCHRPDPRFLIEGLGGECVMCHTDVHFGALGTQCYDCHQQEEWVPTTFRHASTGFPLTGAHRVVACRDCHRNNVFGGTPDECIFCHAEDASADSVHKVSPAFTFCSDCHTTHLGWQDNL